MSHLKGFLFAVVKIASFAYINTIYLFNLGKERHNFHLVPSMLRTYYAMIQNDFKLQLLIVIN